LPIYSIDIDRNAYIEYGLGESFNMQEADRLRFREHLKIQHGVLFVDGVSCKELAERFDTPLYVFSEKKIRQNYRTFSDSLKRVYRNILVCPAYKANSHLAICRVYENEGGGAEVVSPSELRTALDAGVEPEKIVYNGPMKKQTDLELAISSEIGLINADSLPELEHMQEASRRVNKRCNAGLRINVGINPLTHPHLATAQREHKFGIWIGDAIAAYRTASKKPELNMIGMHCHVGSNISETKVIREMANEIFKLANEIKETVGLTLSKIDLGGGLGFPYEPSSPTMTTDDYASSVLKNNNVNFEKLGNPTLIFEPGRAIVADAGILLTTVNVLKHQGDVDWSIVDAGMSMFLRPALYGAKHQILLANRTSDDYETYSVGGPCCESADALAHDISLPKLMEGDLLAVLDVGAYGFTMSSNYNGQPRPAVVLVRDGEGLLIRRRDTYEDMTAPEVIPPHLLKG